MDYLYEVINPGGQPVMAAPESCRYSRRLELAMLEAGYTIKLNGKKLTKAEVRKGIGRK